MNDFDYDVMQKKRIAASARKKVCGSKSKRCSLPSDHLTPKQLKERSGPVMSFNLSFPMSYDEFKSMPRDLQQKYLNELHSRFGVGGTTISRDLFHMSNATLPFYAKQKGLTYAPGKKLSADAEKRWEAWLAFDHQMPEAIYEAAHCSIVVKSEEEQVEVAEEIKRDPVEEARNIVSSWNAVANDRVFEVSDLAATFVGEFDPTKFLKWVSMLPIPDRKVKIRLEVMSDV